MRTITVGARGSKLSRVQADYVLKNIKYQAPDANVTFLEIKTSGDKDQNAQPHEANVGFFTKEIESALLEGRIDVAVHSLKDLPVRQPNGLLIAAVTKREDPRDALISKNATLLSELPARSKIGTSSFRRKAQLLALRPDLDFVPIRGNIDTRINKLQTDGYDAIIVAFAALLRLGLQNMITELISLDKLLPAAGQGALAIETRADDDEIIGIARALNHAPTERETQAERAALEGIGAGCHAPAGFFASSGEGFLSLEGVVASTDGKSVYRENASGREVDAREIGLEVAKRLLATGAAQILKNCRQDLP